jgi:hypothetical protein
MKHLFKIRLLIAAASAGLYITAASAQTSADGQPGGAVQSKEQTNQQQYFELKKKSVQTQHPLTVEKRNQVVSDKKAAPTVTNASVNSTAPSSKSSSQQLSIDQLRIAKKQAADKGLSTEEYDKAIKEIITNQAK